MVLEKEGHEATLSIPCGGKKVKRTLLKDQIQLAGMTVDQYLRFFK